MVFNYFGEVKGRDLLQRVDFEAIIWYLFGDLLDLLSSE